MSVQNLALQRNAFVLQNSGLTPRIETLDVVLRQKNLIYILLKQGTLESFN